MSEHSTLDIKLLGREFRVVCPPEEREALEAAAAFLEAKMAEIAQATRSTGERLAVMAALNLAHELLSRQQGQGGVDAPEVKRRIAAMEARLDAALAPQEDLF